ncbi:MAG: hypothetical protein WBM09_12020 [Gallionella sp.]
MNFRNRFTIAAQTLGAAFIVAILVAACGGGGGPSGFVQSYTTSVGAGDILQFRVDTGNMVYSVKVIETSYSASAVGLGPASAVSLTESTTGMLSSRNAVGSYNVMPSIDGFIQGGEVYPLQNGIFVGHVIINPIGGSLRQIPVFGGANAMTSLAGLAGEYNVQGFGCNVRSRGLVTGGACANHYGTAWITPVTGGASAAITTCDFGNLTSAAGSTGSTATGCAPVGSRTPSGSTPTKTGNLVTTATPGVYNFMTDSVHRAWLFAFSVAGQNIAVFDYDDINAPSIFGFGHAVAIAQTSVMTSMQSGQMNGYYFVTNNIGGRHLLTITGTSTGASYTDNDTDLGIATPGTLTPDSPWPGLVTYTTSATSGVADIATAGAFTYTSNTVPYLFGVGLRY